MKKIVCFLFTIVIMVVISIICLWCVSLLAYKYKWQADKALIGITLTYIVTGFVGGLSQKVVDKEAKSMGRKMMKGMLISSMFVIGLLLLSMYVIENPFEMTSRFMMIWMLLMGSTCLGSVL